MASIRLASLSSLTSKSNMVSTVLVGNALVWYFAVLVLLQSPTVKSTLWVWVVHFSALILSAFAGASFAKQVGRSRLLSLWMILGIIASMMVVTLNSSSGLLVGLAALFLGLSLGLGMPSCMSYFTDSVPVERRGRVSGITMFATGIGIVAFGFLEFDNLLLVGLILGIWRLSSLLVFLWAKDYRRIEQKERVPSYKAVLGQHSFILYFVPWIMFSFVNYLAVPMAPSYSGISPDPGVVQYICLGASAILGGFLVDSVGRKRLSIAGFAMLGVGTAVLGFFSKSLQDISPLLLYFNSVIDGIAWGFLLVLFVLTLWGDLSHGFSSDKYYALGVMPFFASKLLELTIGPYILESITSPAALFSFTAFFLFLAVLPLFYAPETLPEKVMKDRDLKSYVEKAVKKVQTETEREKKTEPESAQNDETEFQVQPEAEEEYDEAKLIAEKYY